LSGQIPDPEMTPAETISNFATKIDFGSGGVVSGPGIRQFKSPYQPEVGK